MMSIVPAKGDASARHVWHFVKLGGFDQVTLKNGSDLVSLDQLDQKLWAALSCPAYGLEFDEKTLSLIDMNGDGRIRAPEIIAAAKWAGSLLKNPDDLMTGEKSLPLSAIDHTTPEGKEILASAREILVNLGKPDAAAITPEDTEDTAKIFAETQFNGDGIIPVSSSNDEATTSTINDIIACLGFENDRSGAPGVSREKVDVFFSEADAYAGWWKLAEEDAENVLPYGNETEEAAAIFSSIREKVDDYFTRCRLVAFDPNAAEALNPSKESLEALSKKELSAAGIMEIAILPLAAIEAEKPLSLSDGLNPAWMDTMVKLSTEVVTPLFGEKETLTANEWNDICAKFSPYLKWLDQKVGTAVESLGIERVREILNGDSKVTLESLIEKDEALAPQAEAVSSVDRLVRYHRDLYTFLNNFVSFHDFYTPGKKSVFQAGTLYLDARSCDLCVKVNDLNKHSDLAQLSQTYLAYCECTRKGTSEKLTIAAAFTNGSSDNLRVGRNGLFYDRQGRDWDAVIVKLIEHSISLRQAFWSPYKRISQLISAQIAKITKARDEQLQANVSKSIDGVLKEPGQKKGLTAQGFDIAKFAGVFAAIGLAVGAIGTALASLMTGFLDLIWWEVPLAISGIILLISGPSVINGYINLKRRNLGPILDACGWAINTRAKINIPFGAMLTRTAVLPPGSRRSLKKDPYSQKKRSWKFYAFFILALAATVFLAVIFYPKGRDSLRKLEDKAIEAVEDSAQQKEISAKPPQKK